VFYVRLFVFVLVAALWPATVHASFWSWLEELSGPGPFRGYMVSFPVPCPDAQGVWRTCHVGPGKTQTVVVRFGRLNSEGHLRFKDLPDTPENRREVHVIPVSVLWMFHPHRSVEVGPGAGFLRVSGEGFDGFARLSLTPVSASFSPFALKWDSKWAYLLRLEYDSSFFPRGFKGTDFQNTATRFDSGAEVLTRAGVVLDFGTVIFGK
jgi:hypothetical protein